ncbi:lachesin-like [Haliotis rufescens]|uniref:lachesin-like n=1 Tax=Haliotis rufescens TaxID=6454 RepID=UPI001EB08640|nr:lachesin-like [Haliotis rufescens]
MFNMFEDLYTIVPLFILGMTTAFQDTYFDEDPSDPLPRFLPNPSNYTYRVGQTAVLKCEVENLGEKKVSWRRASESSPLTVGTLTFIDDNRFSIRHPQGSSKWHLVIDKVNLEDAGIYECQVPSKVRHLRSHILLIVRERRTTKTALDIQITGKPFVEKGDTILLMCNATGKDHPPDDLDWFKNGNKLLTQYANKVYIRKFVSLTTKTIVSILEIKDATLEDAGMYVCRTSDLQITSARVNVLKTDTSNWKRGTAPKNSTSGATSSNNGTYSSHNFTFVILMIVLTVLKICVWCPR